jgi:uncharacterized membrane-anchored protein YjiN (DUF445 family)
MSGPPARRSGIAAALFRTPMHGVAFGLLLAAVGLLVLSHVAPLPPVFAGYLQAFAEAAVVGGMADWFAVVALFRHPLGIPIPHTAIVPANKDRIGVALGEFVQSNFLTREVIGGHLAKSDLAASLAGFLADRAHARPLAARLAELAPEVLDALDASDAHAVLRAQLTRALTRMDGVPLVRGLLDAVLTDERRAALFEALLRQAFGLLDVAEPELRRRIHDRSGWLSQTLRLDERVADRVLDGAAELLQEIEADPQHPWRARFGELIDDFLADLQRGPHYRERIDEAKHALLEHPMFAGLVAELWQALGNHVRDAANREDSGLREYLERALLTLGGRLRDDDEARATMNHWLRGVLTDVAVEGRSVASTLIADTVRTWDADTIAGKLEDAVGRDLQFIRVNGTLIGGLIGLLLHAAAQLFGA